MKLGKFAYLYSKPLGNHTLKIMKKIPENLFKNLEISWNFVSPKKWEPCSGDGAVIVASLAKKQKKLHRHTSFTWSP